MIQYRNAFLTVFESALYRTTSTVIQTDDLVLLVDPTWLPQEIAEIRTFVREIIGNRPLYLLFTHSDYDHIIGFRAFPEARIIASERLVQHPDPASCLQDIHDFDQRFYIRRSYPIEFPSSLEVMVRADGQQFQKGDTRLNFYLAPGHNADGIFTMVEPQGIFIAGDYLSNVEFPFIYHSSQDYIATLEKLDPIYQDHPWGITVSGHGDVAIGREEWKKRQGESLQYIHDLQQSVRESGAFEPRADYIFLEGIREEHGKNIDLVKREMGFSEVE